MALSIPLFVALAIGLVGLLIALVVYHAIVMQRFVLRQERLREATLDRLKQSQTGAEQTRDDTREWRKAQEADMAAIRERREEVRKLQADNVLRMEELLRLQREQLSVLQGIAEHMGGRDAQPG